MAFFLDVAEESRKLGDFFTTTAILGGLQSSAMLKLDSLWSGDPKLRERTNNLHNGFISDPKGQRQAQEKLLKGNEFFIPDINIIFSNVFKVLESGSLFLSEDYYPLVADQCPMVNVWLMRLFDRRCFEMLRASQKFRMAGWVKVDPAANIFFKRLNQYRPNGEQMASVYFERAKLIESQMAGKKKGTIFTDTASWSSNSQSRFSKKKQTSKK